LKKFFPASFVFGFFPRSCLTSERRGEEGRGEGCMDYNVAFIIKKKPSNCRFGNILNSF